jgi:hypothetical protein
VYKKEKERLLMVIDEHDIKAKTIPLYVAKRATKIEADEMLARLRGDEESKWAERAKVKHVQQGGDNTKYFYFL